MTETFDYWLSHFIPVLVMITVVIMNHAVMAQRNEKKTTGEASRFSAALTEELLAMLEVYRMNLELIEQKAKYLLSTRSSTMIYKGNINRLTGLVDSSVIRHVVKSFAQNERIEAIVAAHSNLKCNLAYQFSPAEINFDAWKDMYEQAADQIASTCQILEAGNRMPELKNREQGWREAIRKFLDQPSTGAERRLAVG